MYVEEDNNYVLTHRFNLPAHLYNFKLVKKWSTLIRRGVNFRELSWNVERDEFYALGVSPRMHIDEIGKLKRERERALNVSLPQKILNSLILLVDQIRIHSLDLMLLLLYQYILL